MAKIILVNPTKKRRRLVAAKKKTTARKPAAKAAQRRKVSRPPAKRSRKNPGQLEKLLGLIERKKAMKKKATTKRRRKNPTAAAPRRRRRNPVVITKARHTRRRRNPSLVGRAGSTLKTGLVALGGLVITRQLPQLVMKEKNSGIIGYAANFVTMLMTAAAASKWLGKESGTAAGIGGSLYLANRIISEQFSPIPKALSLSGVGDAAAATPGQLGAIRPAYFPMPVTYNPDGSPAIPSAITDAVKAQINPPAPPASKVAGYRMGRR